MECIKYFHFTLKLYELVELIFDQMARIFSFKIFFDCSLDLFSKVMISS